MQYVCVFYFINKTLSVAFSTGFCLHVNPTYIGLCYVCVTSYQWNKYPNFDKSSPVLDKTTYCLNPGKCQLRQASKGGLVVNVLKYFKQQETEEKAGVAPSATNALAAHLAS